jgi:hypothetical protein
VNPPSAVRLDAPGGADPAVPDGMIEIRPCSRCGTRLAAPEPEQGKLYACPGCGQTFRALAAAGPFSHPSSTPPPAANPAAPVVPDLAWGGAEGRPSADPTPLVSSVGALNLGVAAFCMWLAALAWSFGSAIALVVWGALTLAFVLVGLAVFARWRWAWSAALIGGGVGAFLTGLSIWSRAGPGVIVFGAYAVYALAVMLIPGTRDEFRPRG